MRPVTSSVPVCGSVLTRIIPPFTGTASSFFQWLVSGADARRLRQLVDEDRAGEIENYTPLERIAVMHLLEERLAEEKEPAWHWPWLLALIVGSVLFWIAWAFFLVRFMT